MKTAKILTILVLAIVIWAKVSNAASMGTAFTYQGHLYDANHAANDTYDFQFKIYDDPYMGTQIGLDFDVKNVDVIDGYFTVELDFGGAVFAGDGRWLEIGVRPGELGNPNVYTILAPRQKITPAPYAIYAESSGSGGVSVPLVLSGSVASPSAIINGTNTGTGSGMYGKHDTSGNYGYLGGSTYGVSGVSSTGYGVYGYSMNGYAGYFNGKLRTTSDLYVTGRFYDSSANAGTSGQVLSSTAMGTNWTNPSTGDITAVNAGTGLAGGGTAGDVTLAVGVPLSLTGSIASSGAVISGTNTSNGYGVHGTALSGYGVYGTHYNSDNYGYLGGNSYGVYGKHTNFGNYGYLGGSTYGVYGHHSDSGNYGYIGSNTYGVYGSSSSGHAGYFNGKCYINGKLSLDGASGNIELEFQQSGAYKCGMGYDSTNDHFYIYKGGNVVVKDGKLGVGTTTPAGKLDVNGSIYQRGGVLHADYVFEQDYKLETIEEHSEFMWQNKHLSAIPKAKVDENGLEMVEVGSHRKGIVEELEKAHIYIEQLHKQNKVLEERMAKLEGLITGLSVSQTGAVK